MFVGTVRLCRRWWGGSAWSAFDHAQMSQLGLEAVKGVAACLATGEPGGEHHAVIRQHRGGNALVSDGLPERRNDRWPGHPPMAGDGEGVAGMVIYKAQNLHIGAGCAVGQVSR